MSTDCATRVVDTGESTVFAMGVVDCSVSIGYTTGVVDTGVSSVFAMGVVGCGVSTGYATDVEDIGVSTGCATGFVGCGVSTGYFTGVHAGFDAGGVDFGAYLDPLDDLLGSSSFMKNIKLVKSVCKF